MSREAPEIREALAVYATEAPEAERVPPGYRQTEVGVIPEDWEVSKLEDFGQWRGGATPSMRNSVYWLEGPCTKIPACTKIGESAQKLEPGSC